MSMKSIPGPVLFCAFLLQLALASCATRPPAASPAREAADRRRLNQHVIAIGEDGLALEPYDLAHFGKRTPLQTGISRSKNGAVLGSLGLAEAFKTNPAAFPAQGFYFRDIVISNMLSDAIASGKPIAIYVHGGMNNLDKAVQRAEGWIANPGGEPDGFYPIYICWPSDFSGAYWQHLWRVRNGVDRRSGVGRMWTMGTLPIYAATDIATSLVRLPRTVVDLSLATFKSQEPIWFDDVVKARTRYFGLRYVRHCLTNASNDAMPARFEAWRTNDLQAFEDAEFGKLLEVVRHKAKLPKDALSDYAVWKTITDVYLREWKEIYRDRRPDAPIPLPVEVSMGEYKTPMADRLDRLVGGVAFVGTKIGLAGIASGAGTEAWGMMQRRIDAMYQHERSFGGDDEDDLMARLKTSYSETNPDVRNSPSTGVGAMSVLLRSMSNLQDPEHTQPERRLTADVTLIGHSMGAIVLNRGLRDFSNLRVTDVVYMAAACSVKDFAGSVIPYMRRHGNGTQFYNLCLHPRAEERERPVFSRTPVVREISPTGSLLVWIDSFLDRPDAFDDRTLGQFENALIASHMIPVGIQSRVHMVAVDAGEPRKKIGGERRPGEHGNLQEHGGFNSYRFWEPEFRNSKGWDIDARERLRLPDEK